MGAVVSCVQSALRTIGRTIMAVINGIGNIFMAVINGIVSFLDIVVGFLTCHYCGTRRGRARRTSRGFGKRRHRTTATI